MNNINLSDIKSKEIVKGFNGKFIHSDSMTCAYWYIDNGSELPEHAHPHEQVLNMLAGTFEFNLDGEKKILKPGDVVVIPPNIKHTGKAVTDCKILDVFSPVREDLK
jgi:unsaturated pyranuronate lyase